MLIRKAKESDLDGLNNLLVQVCLVHHQGRPDIFQYGAKKYTDDQLKEILKDDQRPIFVAVDEDESVLGYAFCLMLRNINSTIFTDIKTLYIDDLCVDEKCRGHKIGRNLFDFVKTYAKEQGCHNLTLNVWSFNESALKFYEVCGLHPQKIGMELILPGEQDKRQI